MNEVSRSNGGCSLEMLLDLMSRVSQSVSNRDMRALLRDTARNLAHAS
jgi:hypothetical protein